MKVEQEIRTAGLFVSKKTIHDFGVENFMPVQEDRRPNR